MTNSGETPEWSIFMEAARGDPLRALEIEREINGLWFFRWQIWRRAQLEKDKKDKAEAEKRSKGKKSLFKRRR